MVWRDRTRPDGRVERLLSPLARAAGVSPPPVRVCRRGWNAHAGYWRDGRLGITVGAHVIGAYSDEQLRGLLAHEVAHVAYDHPEPDQHRRRDGLAAVAAVLPVALMLLLAGFGAATLLHTLGAAAPLARTISTLVMLIPALTLLLASPWVGEQTGLSRGRDRVRDELCADLAAAQMAGPAAVRAWLRRQPATASGWHGWLAARCERVTAWLLRTHPTTRLRIAAIDQFDPAEDPPTAAARILHGPSAPLVSHSQHRSADSSPHCGQQRDGPVCAAGGPSHLVYYSYLVAAARQVTSAAARTDPAAHRELGHALRELRIVLDELASQTDLDTLPSSIGTFLNQDGDN